MVRLILFLRKLPWPLHLLKIMQTRPYPSLAGKLLIILALATSGCSSRDVAPRVPDLAHDSRLDSWPTQCVRAGKVHKVGEEWTEDCNTCTCLKHGVVDCSTWGCDASTADFPPAKCNSYLVGRMCTKAGGECGAKTICLLSGKVVKGKEVGVCTCECVVDESTLPQNPEKYICPGASQMTCGLWKEKAPPGTKKKRYCFKPCEPKLGVRTCDGDLACDPRAGSLLNVVGKTVCLGPGCAVDLDCPVHTDKACSVSKKDCPADQRCDARVTGLDAGLCARPGNCDTKSGLCDKHSLGSAKAKVGDTCKDDTQCAGNMRCLMAIDESKLLQKAGDACKADDHCCSGSCKNGACAKGALCMTRNRNGYCVTEGCSFAKTLTIRACDSSSTCNHLFFGGLCLRTCDPTKAATCRGHAKDRLGDYECRAWNNLATSGGTIIAKKPICEPGHFLACDVLKSANLDCSAVGGGGSKNTTNMTCRDTKNNQLKDKYDPGGLCLDDTASGKVL